MDKDSIKPLKELLDSVRNIDGFPIGKDEDILALSDPPFYTACPNPYIKQFIEEYGTPYEPGRDNYHRDPFVGDVSEGKNDPIYNAHSYHTKVPHKAIMKFIEHYTDKGDIVFDGFCGTGMTGVAASLLGRRAIVSDLSTIACFIAYTYTKRQSIVYNIDEIVKTLKEIENEHSWMLETTHITNKNSKNGYQDTIDNNLSKGRITSLIWSDVLKCQYCENEYIFYNAAFNHDTGKVSEKYPCPFCKAEISKPESERANVKFFDSAIGAEVTQSKQIPVLIRYSLGKVTYEKKPDQKDLDLIEKIDHMEIPYWYPTYGLPVGDKTDEPRRLGITHVHHFFTKRNLWLLSSIWNKIKDTAPEIVTATLNNLTKRYRFRTSGGGGPSGHLFIPSLSVEKNPFDAIYEKVKALDFLLKGTTECLLSTQSVTDVKNVPANSIDYIFTDPPFGHNLMYSELNFIWESWLKVFTNNKREAIVNQSQKKDINEYTELMECCFKEYYHVLKPNRWITVEFHNSKAHIWNAIQQSITRAGFIIAQVAVLDKKQGTYNQVTASGAVQNDLVINAYKPKKEFAERFLMNAGEGMEVDFVAEQLNHLPIKPNIGRTEKMLFSKMLAHYVENGFKIKYNSTNFYKLLSDNFTELDGYWFSDSQVKDYNKWKSGLSLDELREKLSGQQVLFVTDEKSALTWLYYYLATPHTYSDIYTEYQQVATTSDDAIPELRELLDNNFILENGKYRRPLNESEKSDVKKNQEKELDRAFNKLLKQAKEGKGKIKNVRREALVHGFTKCYQEGRYRDILTVADKLYASTLESSGEIMDFVDIARIKTEGGE